MSLKEIFSARLNEFLQVNRTDLTEKVFNSLQKFIAGTHYTSFKLSMGSETLHKALISKDNRIML